ncbi:hypothetical protein GGF32_005284 [Allomyces javanicus]|nr:hypothetical protein GGF32_005284 [Allomyces javanicus]
MSYLARSGKLSFKGAGSDPAKKSKQRKRKHADAADASASSSPRTGALPDEGWVVLGNIDHLTGPCLVLFPDSDPPSTLYHPSDTDHVVARPTDDGGQFVAASYDPTDVHQVIVATKLPGSSAGEPRWSLKTAEGRYLGADKHGVVSCAVTAVGATEEWNPVLVPDTNRVAFQSVWGQYLQLVRPNDPQSVWQLRADAKDIGFCSSFLVKVQAQAVHAANKRQRRVKDRVEVLDDNDNPVDPHLAAANLRLDHHLVDAKREGKLAEALLDRRAKTKSDRYCK